MHCCNYSEVQVPPSTMIKEKKEVSHNSNNLVILTCLSKQALGWYPLYVYEPSDKFIKGETRWHDILLVYVTLVTVATTPLRFSGYWKCDAQVALRRTQDK